MGLLLLYRGLGLLHASHSEVSLLLLISALLIGHLKSRFILSKTVAKLSMRLSTLPLPLRAFQIYPPPYLFLIAGMIGLSTLFRFLSLPDAVHGFIKIAIGSALLNGSLHFARIIYGTEPQAES